ncbi:Uma2 family endonuclease [Siminovitchia fortis]|uniref:Uma2 family endonuclease n=1 Tax=Siminovitchia fortis TaxID=254758 RepID=A0A451GC93_9BACI|nr:Uma2 family endonuclease [Siminovitchia fortis]RWR12845.1 Uma2 family endonuclease [Siminovitchia fortis]WHY80501.1 Uma2 family endonuclease [Siminovitchia fortis]
MHLYVKGIHSLEQYWQIRENNDSLLEYIDGFIYMSPSPSTKHQRVSRKLGRAFEEFLDGKTCELFYAPYDIELNSKKMEGTRVVIPDITVICDPSGFTDARYVGVPDLIVEILSPTNQSLDLVTKLNLYMDYGVKEYWIANPMLDTITVYTLNEKGMYEQHDNRRDTGPITSKLFDGFQVDLIDIFKIEKA